MQRLRGFWGVLIAHVLVLVHAVDLFVGRAFALFKPEPLRFAADGHAFVGSIGGNALEPALANSLRFEAVQSRRAAPRNT